MCTFFKVGEENKYTEYAYIKQTNGQFAWEKMGEFNAAPDLSGYAKLSGASFSGFTAFSAGLTTRYIARNGGYYLLSGSVTDRSDSSVYASSGRLTDVGIEESFIFTLEDGSKVTKSIRVVSTTNS